MSTSKIEYALIGYKFSKVSDEISEKLEEVEYEVLNKKELNPNNIRILYDSGYDRFIGVVLKEVDNEDDYGSDFEISMSYLKKELKKNKSMIENFVKTHGLDFITNKIDGYVITLYV